MERTLKTPILLILFNRPEITRRVFSEIRKAKPMQLFIAADSPRPGNLLDEKKCKETRDIIKEIDWDCDIHTLFREKNLGCRIAPSSAVTWFFENVEEGIILEDDCVPHPTFFRYCEDLLEKYRNDERIMSISGDCLSRSQKAQPDSYHFSRYFRSWGWASWRRVWKNYDVNIKMWPEIKERKLLNDVFNYDKNLVNYWTKIFDGIYEGKINSWAYQVNLSSFIEGRVTAISNVNLISNIGFGKDATHTTGEHEMGNRNIEEMKFPIQHPNYIITDCMSDSYTDRIVYLPKPLAIKAINKLFRITKKRFK